MCSNTAYVQWQHVMLCGHTVYLMLDRLEKLMVLTAAQTIAVNDRMSE
jgi:hypothetical protein